MDLIIWAGKVSISWLFFYGCYRLFFCNLTHLEWNRFYLIGTLVVSLLLPLIELPSLVTDPLVVYAVPLDGFLITPYESSSGSFDWLMILGVVYLAGALLMAARFAANLWKLNQVWQKATRIELGEENAALYLFADDCVKSFSFIGRIGINHTDYHHHFDLIFRHELVHVRQLHSMDILLVEVLKIFFWFHPVLLYYKESLRELHEYLADREVENRDTYADFLVAYTLSSTDPVLVTNFYKSSLLKQRIHMMYKAQSPEWKRGLYVMTVLTGIGIMAVIASCSAQDSKEKDLAIPPSQVYQQVDQNPEFPGGVQALFNYLSKEIRYPQVAIENNVHGTVFVEFVVMSDGSINDVEVKKGVGYGCDEEAVRVIKAMPKWEPGHLEGKPVNVKFTLPIAFMMEEGGLRVEKNPENSISISPDVNGTLSLEKQPLYIIDGKEIEKEKFNVDPQTIERINVLKGEKALKKYGSKGENGVLEITLKQG